MSLTTERKLDGHQKPISCCEFDCSGNILLSASEDGTFGLFDLRSSSNPLVKRFDYFSSSAVNAVNFHPTRDIVFAASENAVQVFDLRQVSGGAMQKFSFNSDEISSIAVNPKGNFLAASDDSGQVKIVDLERSQLYKTLRNGHSNICSSVQFHPKRPWEAISGGMDCRIVKWDFSTGKIKQTWNSGDISSQSAWAKEIGPLCNPPMVHSVAFNPKDSSLGQAGKFFATARGDGLVVLYDLELGLEKGTKKKPKVTKKKGKKEETKAEETNDENIEKNGINNFCTAILDGSNGGHTAAVSHLVFSKLQNFEGWLISGGNDGNLVLWNWAEAIENSQNVDNPPNTSTEKLAHQKKVNWISSSTSRIGVADTSKKIHIYCIQ